MQKQSVEIDSNFLLLKRIEVGLRIKPKLKAQSRSEASKPPYIS